VFLQASASFGNNNAVYRVPSTVGSYDGSRIETGELIASEVKAQTGPEPVNCR
jgi:hypothetical protein